MADASELLLMLAFDAASDAMALRAVRERFSRQTARERGVECAPCVGLVRRVQRAAFPDFHALHPFGE